MIRRILLTLLSEGSLDLGDTAVAICVRYGNQSIDPATYLQVRGTMFTHNMPIG